jgi:hypothetical protein
MAKNFTESQVKKAIEGSRGIISSVARKLRCDRGTAKTYIKKLGLDDVLEAELENGLDIAESQLHKKIDQGDMLAITYYLNNKGQSRGYNRKNGQSGNIDLPDTIQVEIIEKSNAKH